MEHHLYSCYRLTHPKQKKECESAFHNWKTAPNLPTTVPSQCLHKIKNEGKRIDDGNVCWEWFSPSNSIRHFERYQATNWFDEKAKWKRKLIPTLPSKKKNAGLNKWWYAMPVLYSPILNVDKCLNEIVVCIKFIQQFLMQITMKNQKRNHWPRGNRILCWNMQLICDACDKIDFDFHLRFGYRRYRKKICRWWWFMRRNVFWFIWLGAKNPIYWYKVHQPKPDQDVDRFSLRL